MAEGLGCAVWGEPYTKAVSWSYGSIFHPRDVTWRPMGNSESRWFITWKRFAKSRLCNWYDWQGVTGHVSVHRIDVIDHVSSNHVWDILGDHRTIQPKKMAGFPGCRRCSPRLHDDLPATGAWWSTRVRSWWHGSYDVLKNWFLCVVRYYPHLLDR